MNDECVRNHGRSRGSGDMLPQGGSEMALEAILTQNDSKMTLSVVTVVLLILSNPDNRITL